ncbi:MAG TPA: hypothetical protein PLU35_04270, partial [Phycisphaerales bacterium]|nr:hypothetical protein [Phycisphaerales bacterium]
VAKAIAARILTASDARALTPAERLGLIFRPGFSTAAQVTAISGRGVGMDIVKANVEKIGGVVELRNEEGARAVIIRLLHKAAARMRHLGYEAGEMTVSVRLVGGRAWEGRVELPGGSQDTLEMIGALVRLWARRARGPVLQVGVTLAGLGATEEATLPLFPEEERRRALSRAIDRLNARHGRLTVYTASMQGVRGRATGGIAFASVPDLGFSDTVA